MAAAISKEMSPEYVSIKVKAIVTAEDCRQTVSNILIMK